MSLADLNAWHRQQESTSAMIRQPTDHRHDPEAWWWYTDNGVALERQRLNSHNAYRYQDRLVRYCPKCDDLWERPGGEPVSGPEWNIVGVLWPFGADLSHFSMWWRARQTVLRHPVP